MPLSDEQKAKLRAAAEREGLDADELIKAAEPSDDESGASEARSDGRPVADRLLVGFLPFIKVHELRSLWLGLPDRIPDDELTCGEFAIKHGGTPAPTGSPAPGASGA